MAGGIRTWPDGGTLLDQPVKLVRAFDVIAAAVDWIAKTK